MKLTLPPVDHDDNALPPSLNEISFTLNEHTGITITDEGGGAFLCVESDPDWRVDPDEFVNIAKWAQDVCKQFDGLNKAVRQTKEDKR
jgi:hypothetical protein